MLQADREPNARQATDRHGRGHARSVVPVAPIGFDGWTWRLRLSWRREPHRGRRGLSRFILRWRNRRLRNLDLTVIRRRRLGFHGLRLVSGRRQEQNLRSEEHTSELQSLMRISYAVFCLK